MVLRVVQLGEPILKSSCRGIDPDELASDEVRRLVADMFETLADSGGVGLAAPQVGSPLRLILAGSHPSAHGPDRPDVPTAVLCNPRVVWASTETEAGWEGCLSIPGTLVRVVRPLCVRVEYLDLEGKAGSIEHSGFYARVLQHEIDHLDGILTIDRAQSADDVVRRT